MASSPVTGGARRTFFGTLILLAARGLLLWLLVPLGLFLWAPLFLLLRRRGVSLAQFLGWLDLNLIAAIQRTLASPFYDTKRPWTPLGAAAGLSHRIHSTDAF